MERIKLFFATVFYRIIKKSKKTLVLVYQIFSLPALIVVIFLDHAWGLGKWGIICFLAASGILFGGASFGILLNSIYKKSQRIVAKEESGLCEEQREEELTTCKDGAHKISECMSCGYKGEYKDKCPICGWKNKD